MRDFQQKRNIRKKLYSFGSILFLMVAFILLARSAFGVYKKAEIAKINVENTAKTLTALEERNNFLQSEMSKFETEEGIEEEIRNKFRMAKDGEEMIIIVDDKSSSSVITSEDKSFLDKIKGIFR